jgi:hypothetical protein
MLYDDSTDRCKNIKLNYRYNLNILYNHVKRMRERRWIYTSGKVKDGGENKLMFHGATPTINS